MEQNTQETVQEVIKLIKTSSKHRFRKKEKLSFAYSYWNLSNQDITDLYIFLAHNKSRENAKLAA